MHSGGVGKNLADRDEESKCDGELTPHNSVKSNAKTKSSDRGAYTFPRQWLHLPVWKALDTKAPIAKSTRPE